MTLLAIYIYLMSGHEIGAPQSREMRSPKECHERLADIKGAPLEKGEHDVKILNPTPTIRAIVAICVSM